MTIIDPSQQMQQYVNRYAGAIPIQNWMMSAMVVGKKAREEATRSRSRKGYDEFCVLQGTNRYTYTQPLRGLTGRQVIVSASRKRHSIVHINEEDREVWKVEVAGLRRRRVSSRLGASRGCRISLLGCAGRIHTA